MKKIHVAAIALLLGIGAVLGTFAATRTASLGTAGRRAADTTYTARVKQLDAFSAKLRHELAAKAAPAPLPAVGAVQPRVVYRRPPAIVVVKHSQHGDDGAERSAEGGGAGDD